MTSAANKSAVGAKLSVCGLKDSETSRQTISNDCSVISIAEPLIKDLSMDTSLDTMILLKELLRFITVIDINLALTIGGSTAVPKL